MRKTIDLAHLEVWWKDGGRWDGGTRTYGDVSDDSGFGLDDVEELVGATKTPDDWDGVEAAVLKLKDGRYVSYESTWGPTGSGFSVDAYGGDAVLTFAPDLETIIRWGLTDAGRRLLGVPNPGQPDV